MTDYTKRTIACFFILWLGLGGVLALQHFTGVPAKLLQQEVRK
ncbi:hypothetical protein [Phormidesmis sp. 146-33]